MDYLVIDTDVASRLQRGDLPDELRPYIVGKTICVTFVTVAEFYKGAYKAGWGPVRIAELEHWLRNVVVLPYNEGVARCWGRLSAECEGKGRPIPPNDGWVAACCLSHGIPLMTLNRRHFAEVTGLVLIPEQEQS